ncbi:hypothetical protein BKA65DRAFT_163595 [Rhexocercosporidium sp. MPI-PUGE-AT-0058]|nr:hypothetical protein BKA65DRAFT_163595 [Rhexocercosporidium sp. MPI-PUGE-AT-0058]
MSSLTLNNTALSRTPSNPKFPHASSSPTTSARNSYASVSEGSNAASSARTSYSSIFDPPVRVASFSRTSDEFIPDSASVSTSGSESGDEEVDAADSKARDASHESVIVKKQTPQSSKQGSERERRTKSHIRSGSKDGPSALRELENVKEIICVAFGAFDRYYISWEDDSGDFRQGAFTSSDLFSHLSSYQFQTSLWRTKAN